jgi:transposase
MLRIEEWMDIKMLKQQGHSIRKICELTGHSRNTVRDVLRGKAPKAFNKPERKSLLDEFKSYVEHRYQQCALSCVRLIEEIRPMGYGGGIDTLRRFVRTLKPAARARQKMTVRFETPPGKQSQADWAYCGRFADNAGKLVSVYCFVIILSYSRAMYVEFTTSMKLPILIGCHLRAFDYFGGWTETLLYDNMKQVRIDSETLNPLFVDFASHYGITIKTHQPRRPRTKGKVERMVDYIKDNFLNGRSFSGLNDLNTQGLHWLESVAHTRVHATTGEQPAVLLEQERAHLTPLTQVAPYQLTLKDSRVVDASGFVRYRGSRYSVPPAHVGGTVLVEEGATALRIRSGDLIIAEHKLAQAPGACISQREHIEQLWQLSLKRAPEPQPSWQIRFEQQVETPRLSLYEEVTQ